MQKMRELSHECDVCIIGGGMSGLCAALVAARHGARVVLMHDRPVFGGNASSECRVHICGADRYNNIKNMRETGVLEELRMENLYRNPNRNFSIWDTILFEKIKAEPNIVSLLNCSCLRSETDGDTVREVTGWQLTTQTYHRVAARIFADCSGDAILAPLSGADFRMGREARAEYDESLAPLEADAATMGMTCFFQSREYDTAQPFEPLPWAYRYDSCHELPYGPRGHQWWELGYWFVELGGEHHGIHDTEYLRDELLKIIYGLWDHIKNRCSVRDKARNWALDWVQFLPGKRESRRYVGEHVLTQNDIESGGNFEDIAAYGGWSMDDHHPAGFNAVRTGSPATRFHPAPSPYGIPYRSLYSRNIANLMFAGRDASCTHMAMSSARVAGTGCGMGQAVGTAAALAVKKGTNPAGILSCVPELQQMLLRDDAYLPGISQVFSEITRNARLESSQGDPEPVRDGVNRPVGEDRHGWRCCSGDWIAYRFKKAEKVRMVTVILDSALDCNVTMSFHESVIPLTSPPDVMPKVFQIEGLAGNEWRTLVRVDRNYQRLCNFAIEGLFDAVRFTLEETWGAGETFLYGFYIE